MKATRELTGGYGAILTAMLALLTYALALHNGFAFDDVELIPNDPRVTQGQVGMLLSTSYWNNPELSLYRPLTSVSFALDWFVSNGSAAWFHFTNIVWHVLASTLVYALLLRYFTVVAALIGAAIFAVHPVHVEAVANVVGRGELIASTFVLLACVLWPRITVRLARALIIAVLYFLAMCAKEGAAVLPALLVLIDFADGEWSRRDLLPYLRRRAWEFVALIAVFALFMVIRMSILGRVGPSRLDPSLEVVTSDWHRILTALQAWPLALKVLLFPATLLADYGPRVLLPIAEWNSQAILGATIVLALVGGGTAALVMGHRQTALGLLWYPVTILPVSNFLLPIGVLLAERTLYLPSVAISFGAAALFGWLRTRVSSRRLTNALAVVIIAALAVRSAVRVPEWSSTDRILLTLVRDRPEAFRGHWHAARVWRSRGQVSRAMQEYREAMRLWPYRQGVIQEVAVYASAHGQATLARDVAFFGATRWPQNPVFHRIVAGNALDLGDTTTAVRALRSGLKLHPNDTIMNAMWRAAAPGQTP
ncbi:MAG TPA: hypothetical protein VGD27_13790 [Longimicrobiales bacterium]